VKPTTIATTTKVPIRLQKFSIVREGLPICAAREAAALPKQL
jgi:hypothetical protein